MKKLALLALLVACRSPQQKQEPQATPSASASVVASAAPIADAGDARRAIVDAWNAAHDKHDTAALDALYDDDVVFYQSRVSRAACVATKKAFLAKHPDFKQTIRDVRIADGTTTRASFVKSVTVSGKTKDYPSYLELARRGERWVITTEGDEVTDRNLEAKKCAAIAWSKEWPRDAQGVTLTGRLEPAAGSNATGDLEPYFRFTLDKPACMPAGADPAQSDTVHVYQADKGPDPKAFTGKHVRVTGDPFEQHTAHHHEPIVMAADSIAVVP